MAGIDRITNEIAADADREAASIIESAREAADKLVEEAKQELSKKSDEAKSQTDKSMEDTKQRYDSQCERIIKLKLLSTRQEIIEDVLNKSKTKVIEQSDEDYTALLLRLSEANVHADSGEMYLNARDLSREPNDFQLKINQIAEKASGSLVLSDKPIDIDGGFVLKYGLIEFNLSISSIFEENKEHLLDVVNKVLW